MPTQRIPIFPLPVVLFPGNALPLHIFEPRYKLMIRRSIDESTPFGMVLAHETGIARIGCTALVRRVLRRYDDDRMDIQTLGQAPYRILELHEENPCLEADVELLEDDPRLGPAGVADDLRALCAKCNTLLDIDPPPEIDAHPPASLAYRVAGSLPLDLAALQELLEIRVEADRRRRLVEQLTTWLPQLVQIRQRQSRANGNGHGPWLN